MALGETHWTSSPKLVTKETVIWDKAEDNYISGCSFDGCTIVVDGNLHADHVSFNSCHLSSVDGPFAKRRVEEIKLADKMKKNPPKVSGNRFRFIKV